VILCPHLCKMTAVRIAYTIKRTFIEVLEESNSPESCIGDLRRRRSRSDFPITYDDANCDSADSDCSQSTAEGPGWEPASSDDEDFDAPLRSSVPQRDMGYMMPCAQWVLVPVAMPPTAAAPMAPPGVHAAQAAATGSLATASPRDCDIEHGNCTTLIFRNVPNDYVRSTFVELLESEGFGGEISLVYLPIDFKRNAGFGYAFVNFAEHSSAARAMRHFDGFSQWRMPSRKVCSMAWSEHVQGLQSHVERYRNSPVMHASVPDEFKPAFYVKGVRMPFPAPTKAVHAPRNRR